MWLKCKLRGPTTLNLNDALRKLRNGGNNVNSKFNWLVFRVVCYFIWKERNYREHGKGTKLNKDALFDVIRKAVKNISKARKEFSAAVDIVKREYWMI